MHARACREIRHRRARARQATGRGCTEQPPDGLFEPADEHDVALRRELRVGRVRRDVGAVDDRVPELGAHLEGQLLDVPLGGAPELMRPASFANGARWAS